MQRVRSFRGGDPAELEEIGTGLAVSARRLRSARGLASASSVARRSMRRSSQRGLGGARDSSRSWSGLRGEAASPLGTGRGSSSTESGEEESLTQLCPFYN